MNAHKIKLDRENVEDTLGSFQADQNLTDTELEAWLELNADDINAHLEHTLGGVLKRLAKPREAHQVKAPVLSFDTKHGGKLQLWVYDAHQWVHFEGFRKDGLTYGGETAGLIYEQNGAGGHRVDEHNIWDKGTWAWIQEWMEKGLRSEGHLK